MTGLCMVMANLKERKLGNMPSNGMILCSNENKEKFSILRPPVGSKVGDRIHLEGFREHFN